MNVVKIGYKNQAKTMFTVVTDDKMPKGNNSYRNYLRNSLTTPLNVFLFLNILIMHTLQYGNGKFCFIL